MKKFLLLLLVPVLVLSSVLTAEKTGFTDLKTKLAAGCSVTGNNASFRFWPTDTMGLEFSTGPSIGKDYINFPLSAKMLFSILEKGNFAINLAPAINFTYTKSNAFASSFIFGFGAALLLEMAIPMISENLSIESGIGAGFSVISSTVVGIPSTTDFIVNIVTVSPLIIRYYF